MTDEDIEICNQFKFTYRIPEKIKTESEVETDKKLKSSEVIETLDEIVDSEEEDFEEFYESE